MTQKSYQGWPDFVAELKARGEWPYDSEERRAALSREWNERADDFFRAEETPILEDLNAAGIEANSVWDYSNGVAVPDEAIPILIRHLAQPYHPRIREGVARAVAEPAAAPYWHEILAEFQTEPDKTARDALALALARCSGTKHLPELIEMAKDIAIGTRRIFFLDEIRRHKTPEAWATIESLAEDPQVGEFARKLLAKRAKAQARKMP